MAKLVSKTYGEALFELAMEQNPDSFLQQISRLDEIIKENPDFDRLMKHPGISKQEKIKVLENVFEGHISKEIMGFLQVVITKERYRDLPAIFSYFIARMKEHQRIGIAYVTTAKALSDTQRAQVEKRLLETTSYETMEMHFCEEPGILGGMIIRINDRVVDSSIRSKINDLTKQLLQIQLG